MMTTCRFGKVYDFTEFAPEHPAGAQALLDHAGTDASEVFKALHNMALLDDFDAIGVLAT
jgi:L-lactate dehydrogenase (cytochrome)